MKKIKAITRNDNDRIIWITADGNHNIYYQPFNGKEKHWIMQCKYSRSIYTYFHGNGKRVGTEEYSLTVRQFYKFRAHHNLKLGHLMSRLPGLIDYVLQSHENDIGNMSKISINHLHRHKTSHSLEDEIAA